MCRHGTFKLSSLIFVDLQFAPIQHWSWSFLLLKSEDQLGVSKLREEIGGTLLRTAAKADEMGARGEWKGRGKVLNERCVTFGQVEEVNASKN